MECASPAIEVVKLLWHPVVRQINYIRNVGDNMKELERKIDELASLENDVRDKVTSAEWETKKTMAVVNNWLKKVKERKDEASEIKKEFEENRRCLMGCLPNCCSQRKISKRTLKLIEEVNELNKKGSFEDVVIANPPPATSQVMPATSLVGSTAEQNFDRIWNLLMEENSGIIGIYGMGGVGKTTIMKKINNQLESTEKFDIVIWVTVSKDFNLKRLQCAIAERLKLHKDLDEEGLSIQLHEVLRRKKFLLVLDDVWDRIPVEEVGIPEPRNGCKLVLTTRSQRVCELMEANTFIRIKELSKEEAWSLFKEKVGATALVDSDVEEVAKHVANECKGLPLALITVGRALRGVSDIGQWRHALKQLQNSKQEVGDIEDEVFGRLRFSYQKLKSEKLRTCYLYCSLFPEDYVIPKHILIELWICEGFIEEDGDRQAMVDEGQSILNELVEACMLESTCAYEVKMHDLMRDMAIGITRKCPIFMVKAGIGLEKVVADKEWVEDVERISLMRNKIKMLSGEPPKCPKLVTLFLNQNPISHFESPSFFQHMNQLRVLDLSYNEIEELPESVSSLENLHMLYLGGCRKLKRVPSLANLKNLRCLDLSFTCIEELPESVSRLENLHMLDLVCCKKLKRVPSLAKLKNLRCLALSYICMEELPKGMEELVELRSLSLEGTPDLKGIRLHGTLANLQKFSIGGCPKLKNLFSLGTLQSLQSLKTVTIFDCIAMEEVVSREEDDKTDFNTVVTLPNLVSFRLFDLPALQSICSGTMVCSSLKRIEIMSCCKLKKIPLIIDKPHVLADLMGTREWWDALDWADLAHTKDLLKSSFKENNEESSSSSAEDESEEE